jgi:hypothetical protein
MISPTIRLSIPLGKLAMTLRWEMFLVGNAVKGPAKLAEEGALAEAAAAQGEGSEVAASYCLMAATRKRLLISYAGLCRL